MIIINKWQEAFDFAYKHYVDKHEYWRYQLSLDYAEFIMFGVVRNR